MNKLKILWFLLLVVSVLYIISSGLAYLTDKMSLKISTLYLFIYCLESVALVGIGVITLINLFKKIEKLIKL